MPVFPLFWVGMQITEFTELIEEICVVKRYRHGDRRKGSLIKTSGKKKTAMSLVATRQKFACTLPALR